MCNIDLLINVGALLVLVLPLSLSDSVLSCWRQHDVIILSMSGRCQLRMSVAAAAHDQEGDGVSTQQDLKKKKPTLHPTHGDILDDVKCL